MQQMAAMRKQTVKNLWRKHLVNIFQMEKEEAPSNQRLDYAMMFFPDGRQMITSMLSPVTQ